MQPRIVLDRNASSNHFECVTYFSVLCWRFHRTKSYKYVDCSYDIVHFFQNMDGHLNQFIMALHLPESLPVATHEMYLPPS